MKKRDAEKVLEETGRRLGGANVVADGPQKDCGEAAEAVRRAEGLIRGVRWGISLALTALDSDVMGCDADDLVMATVRFLRTDMLNHESVPVGVDAE